MTWFKVDDKLHSHNKIRKVLAEEPAALALWTVAGSWSSDNLTDGFVPDHQLPWLLPKGADELAQKLVTVRLWRRVRGGYQFHEWEADGDGTKRNPTRKEVEAERRKKAEAGRKGGLASGKTRSRSEAPASASASPRARARAGQVVEPPSRPDPVTTTHPPYAPQGRTAREREAAPPTDGPPTRVEQILTAYRENSPRGIPAKQAERLAGEIHQLVQDGYTDDEITHGLSQLRVRRLGPSMLPALVDELANQPRVEAAQPGSNVVPFRPGRGDARPSTTDQRVSGALALADQFDALDAEGSTRDHPW